MNSGKMDHAQKAATYSYSGAGPASWTWTDGSTNCSGGEQLTLARI